MSSTTTSRVPAGHEIAALPWMTYQSSREANGRQHGLSPGSATEQQTRNLYIINILNIIYSE
jgi:hypothetical protein